MNLGYTDDDGYLYCALCSWCRMCDTVEQMEFYIVKHAREAHGRTVRFRICSISGHCMEIPNDTDLDV